MWLLLLLSTWGVPSCEELHRGRGGSCPDQSGRLPAGVAAASTARRQEERTSKPQVLGRSPYV